MEEEYGNLVKSILINHFHVHEEAFDWNKPLQKLNNDLVLLGHLMYFEQLLFAGLNRKIPMVEHISANFHTPGDVLKLIKQSVAGAGEK